MCVDVCMCVCACICACVCVYECVCLHGCTMSQDIGKRTWRANIGEGIEEIRGRREERGYRKLIIWTMTMHQRRIPAYKP